MKGTVFMERCRWGWRGGWLTRGYVIIKLRAIMEVAIIMKRMMIVIVITMKVMVITEVMTKGR